MCASCSALRALKGLMSPRWLFDHTHDAEAAIVRPSGAWFHCTAKRPGDIGAIQVCPYLSADEIAHLMARIARVATRPAASVRPAIHCRDSRHDCSAAHVRLRDDT